jgi:hypothetical protein
LTEKTLKSVNLCSPRRRGESCTDPFFAKEEENLMARIEELPKKQALYPTELQVLLGGRL